MSRTRCWDASVLIAYTLAIVGANWLTSHRGLIAVGFGLHATAGTYCAGVTLALRNVIQERWGRKLVLAALAAGAVLSATTSPAALALASGLSFLTGELLDTAVYTPLRRHGWIRAVLIGSAVGTLLDTVSFLYLAHFPLNLRAVGGQLVGKTWAVWLPTLALAAWTRLRRRPACAT